MSFEGQGVIDKTWEGWEFCRAANKDNETGRKACRKRG